MREHTRSVQVRLADIKAEIEWLNAELQQLSRRRITPKQPDRSVTCRQARIRDLTASYDALSEYYRGIFEADVINPLVDI